MDNPLGERIPNKTSTMKKSSMLIFSLFTLIILGGSAFYFLRNDPIVSLPTFSDIHTERVAYHQSVQGYLATPKGGGPYPGVILIHEWWGLNADMESIAERYARAGYVALAVDLYDGASTTDQETARTLSGKVREHVDEAFLNLQSAMTYLQSNPLIKKDHIASVGWCFGGGWSYQMAINNLGVKGSVMYYGQFDPEDDFSHMKAHILGHFGENDAAIKIDSVKEFQAKLVTPNGPHEIYIYPNVGHGFANQRGGTNIAYRGEASELAWTRTMMFLDQLFADSTTTPE